MNVNNVKHFNSPSNTVLVGCTYVSPQLIALVLHMPNVLDCLGRILASEIWYLAVTVTVLFVSDVPSVRLASSGYCALTCAGPNGRGA